MKILTGEQMHNADLYTISNEPIDSVDLMERASRAFCYRLKELYGDYLNIKIFAGPGNNGGDGLAIARMLAEENNAVTVFMLSQPEKLSPDVFTNYKRLNKKGNVGVFSIDSENLPIFSPGDIVIDAMFGSGLSRPVEGLAAQVINHINQTNNIIVVAVDIPSGLFGENKSVNRNSAIIKAKHTLTFQIPKLSFFFAENEQYTGCWEVLDIGLLNEGIENQDSKFYYTEEDEIRALLKHRKTFSHKGTFGHALLVAGSYGKMGASVLASKACLKSGVGLLTTHIPSKGYEILQTSVPEAMVSVDVSEYTISDISDFEKYSAIGIGPGIGISGNTKNVLEKIVKQANVSLVLDADALNLLSLNRELMDALKPGTILTPHPGEFDRIAGVSVTGYERLQKQIALSVKLRLIVVLKGAYTSITTPDGECYFNSTGNPGMATAGSGDVLTGIILSLLAQKYTPLEAARLGVYVHGLAGDIFAENSSEEALNASDIINSLGFAFNKIKKAQHV